MIRYTPLLALLLCSATPRSTGLRLLVPESFRGHVVVVTGLACGQAPTYVGGVEEIRVPENGIVILRDGLCFFDGHIGVMRNGAEVEPPAVDHTAPPTRLEQAGVTTREGSRYDKLSNPEISRMKHASFAFTDGAGNVLGPLEALTLTAAGGRLGADGQAADQEALYSTSTGSWFEGEGTDRVTYTSYFIGEPGAVQVQLSAERKAELLAAVRVCRGR